ncbi:hypothetical protein A3K82_01485 [Candidatus Pacearchaeota archaeon RBG_19FT_COMBO_34_9]|nr:MAG: hypothetical protein A3K82_01485 [Candidatus Pacearchaeota archaeon RBG_19FT_COMBO_34_9]OGJ16326.1 MAG: hypothetical protein A3K74_01890 [Candidatus Pacearchaeota archaeon RBG_13_33_26]
MLSVDQNSELGKLGLSALVENGSKPNYELRDIKVNIKKIAGGIYVSLNDMECFVSKNDKYYPEMNALLSKD